MYKRERRIEMEIIRREEGRYVRKLALNIDEDITNFINERLEESLVGGGKYERLTIQDIWDIMTKSIDAPRYKEEYFVELEFYSGMMKLGDFVRKEINAFFEVIPGEIEDETVDVFYDEFYP